MPWRLVPRRSKPYLASAVAAASPRHKPPCREPPSPPLAAPSTPPPPPSRRVAFLDLRGTHCASLKRALLTREVSVYLPLSLFPSPSPPKPPRSRHTRCRTLERWLRRFEGERTGRTSHLDSTLWRVHKRERARHVRGLTPPHHGN